jgi:hypothetical protein
MVTVVPPYLSGPFFSLQLRQNVLSGWVSGDSAPGGSLHVTIEDDGAAGHGPHGPVAMDFFEQDADTVAEGVWNGQRVHLVFGEQGLRGTVADKDSGRGADKRDSWCQYVLDHADGPRTFTGVSICAGLPQQTRLDVPPAALSFLRRPELVTLLVVLLSAPPLAVAEGYTPLGPDRVGEDGLRPTEPERGRIGTL